MSCWVTGPTSMVIAGTATGNAADGALVVVDGQRKKHLGISGSGALAIHDVRDGHACLGSASGRTAQVALRTDAPLSSDGSCARPSTAISQSSLRMAASEIRPMIQPPMAAGGAPDPAASYYVWGDFVSECGPTATSGCRLYVDGANEPAPGGGGLVVLDFGAPCSVPGSSPEIFGTQLFNTTTCSSDDQLVPLAQAWLRGYESTHSSATPTLIFAAGTSTSINSVDPAPLTASEMSAAGQAWYRSVVLPLATAGAVPAPVTFWSGNDIELSSSSSVWYGPTESQAWVDGYGAAANITAPKSCAASSPFRMADYGDDILLNYSWTRVGPQGWTDASVYHVAWGAPVACAVPEIYVSANATEWQQLSEAAAGQGLPRIIFTGPMALAADTGTLSPGQSWSALANATGQSPPYLTVIGALFPNPPSAPSGVIALGGETSATVYWSAPASDGGSPVTGYTVTAFSGATAAASATVGGLPPQTSATVNGLTDGSPYTFTVTATNAAGAGSASLPSSAMTPGRGATHALKPARILDTRTALGGHQGALGPNGSLVFQVTGQGGVPATGVTAVVLNVTATDTTAASYLTVWPAGVPRPLASNLNWTGGTVANLVEVALGPAGQAAVYNAAGTTDVVADVAGFVSTPTVTPGPDGLYNPSFPFRALDTRNGIGGYTTPVGPQGLINVQVAGRRGSNVPSTGASAIVLNLTVTGPTAPSYVTVFPAGSQQPLASNINFVAGQTVANRVIVEPGTGGMISIFNAAGSVDVVADISGWFTDGSNPAAGGGAFVAMTPTRILDTRNGQGPIGPGGTLGLAVAGQNTVPATATAVVLNVTVTNPTAPSYLTLWPSGYNQPLASDINYATGVTVPNLVVVRVGSGGSVNLFNAAGSADAIVDILGWYD